MGKERRRDTLPLFFRAIGLEEENWKDRAACLGADQSLFFSPSEPGATRGPQGKLEAKEYCKECPVRVECLEYAVRNRECWGVWGGIDFGSQRQRTRFLNQKIEGIKEINSLNGILNDAESRKES